MRASPLPVGAGTYRYRAKSKSGCLTCKRIKCDENRPNCLRCSSTGRKCDGYGTPSPPAKYHYRLPTPTFSPPREDDRETRSFQFFYERTVPALAGYCGSEFWSRLVLQVSQHEKSVWHALIALGSLHENFEKEQAMPGIEFLRKGPNNFAIREYLLAIRGLLGPADTTSNKFVAHTAAVGANNVTVDVCLISCILFTCFEILSGHYGPAINHVRSGIGILGEVYYDTSSGTFRHPHLQPSTVTRLEMENMRKIFIRLQGQASTLTRTDMDNPSQDSGEIPATLNVSIEIQESYSSIAEARDDFESVNRICVHHYHKIMGSVPPAEASDMSAYLLQQYGTLLHKWCAALAHFEASRGESLTSKERMGLQLLNIYKHNIIMYYEYAKSTEAALFSSENNAAFSWDEYNSRFAEIVSLAASVVESTTSDTGSPFSSPSSMGGFDSINGAARSRPLFSLDNGVVGPLYNVATLCRDPIIRRKAVDVLRLARRQEGVFNSHLCAIVAEKVIEIEEAAASEQALDYQNNLPSLKSFISDEQLKRLEKAGGEITESSEVPDTARLTYAYPKFDLVKQQIFLTIGQSMKMHVDIPWPAMNFLIDAGN